MTTYCSCCNKEFYTQSRYNKHCTTATHLTKKQNTPDLQSLSLLIQQQGNMLQEQWTIINKLQSQQDKTIEVLQSKNEKQVEIAVLQAKSKKQDEIIKVLEAKSEKQDEIIKVLQAKNEEQENITKDHHKSIDKLLKKHNAPASITNNVNNITNNKGGVLHTGHTINIVLNDFGKENTKHIDIGKILHNPNHAVKELARAIYRDDKYPENQNIVLKDGSRHKYEIRKDGEWVSRYDKDIPEEIRHDIIEKFRLFIEDNPKYLTEESANNAARIKQRIDKADYDNTQKRKDVKDIKTLLQKRS